MAVKELHFNSVEEIFKYAITVENRGFEFYRNAAERTSNDTARQFFEEFAEEEREHKRVLAELYKTWKAEGKWKDDVLREEHKHGMDIHDPIIGQAIRKGLASDSYDTTAVDIAIVLEKEASAFYSTAADRVEDPELQRILRWLAEWEDDHLRYMVELNESLRETYWNDNNFWPF